MTASRIAVITGDPYHSADGVMAGLRALHEFAFERVSDGGFEAASAIVLAKLNVRSPDDPTPWLTDDIDARLREFVHGGGGLLVVHAGTVGYPVGSAIREMTGGAFVRHPEPVAVAYAAERDAAPDPIFTVRDEHYFVDTDPGVEIFLRSASIHGVQPAGWRSTYGKGRVSAITAGHFDEVWMNPGFQEILRSQLRDVVRLA